MLNIKQESQEKQTTTADGSKLINEILLEICYTAANNNKRFACANRKCCTPLLVTTTKKVTKMRYCCHN